MEGPMEKPHRAADKPSAGAAPDARDIPLAAAAAVAPHIRGLLVRMHRPHNKGDTRWKPDN
jgi:hypothetical protein